MVPAVRSLKFRTLVAVCQIIDKALALEEALEEILRILSDELSMQRGTITLLDPSSGRLFINASYGLTQEEKQRGVYELDEGVTGRIFRTAQAYYVPDVSKEPLFLNKTGTRKPEKATISFLGVPIMLHGDSIGVLNVDRLFSDDVSYEEDIDFLSVVATLIAQFISLGEEVRKRESLLKAENVSLKYQIAKENKGPYIVGRSNAMQEVQRQMSKVAPTRATVLLLGESGVGKTLIARIIHEVSDRSQHPFVKVNCASIPENLLESELFGYEKGAFTGATGSKPGRFEDADGGTIFLDEIGELPTGIQAKLLRVLQEREFERLGSNRTRNVDVRILAATNKDLESLSDSGQFRPDLFYRLSVFPIRVPALRERTEDIPGLMNHFLKKMAYEYGRQLSFTPKALDAMTHHPWPGNVREMENLIERLVIMAERERVDLGFLREHLEPSRAGLDTPPMAQPTESTAATAPFSAASGSLTDMERAQVVAALERNGFVQYKAAEDLGLSPRQMGYRVRKYGLEGLIAEGRAKMKTS